MIIHPLWRVDGRNFVAGFETKNGMVHKVAPILHKLLHRKPIGEVFDICVNERGWKVTILDPGTERPPKLPPVTNYRPER